MDKLTVYQKPTCSKCRETLAILRAAKTPFVTVDYFGAPLTVATLRRLVKKLGVSPREILRTGEEIYKQLQLDTKELSDDELIRLMVVYPDLIQRPIIEKGDRAVMGRPPENVKALLQKGRGPESIPSGPLFIPKRSTTISSIRRRPYRLSPP